MLKNIISKISNLTEKVYQLQNSQGNVESKKQDLAKYSFSKTSMQKLNTCHSLLQKLFNQVIKDYDCIVIEGFRDSNRQLNLFNQGKSKVRHSNHNYNPSLAIDVSPYPIPKNWGSKDKKQLAKFYHFAGFVLATANNLGIDIRWGGDWNSNNDFSDQTFDDLVHFELV